MSNIVKLSPDLEDDEEFLEILESIKTKTKKVILLAVDEENTGTILHNFEDRGQLAVAFFELQELTRELLQ